MGKDCSMSIEATEPQRIGGLYVGMKVRAKHDIYEEPSGDSPGGYCCRSGDVLIVRKIRSLLVGFPISVSHENILDNSFGVNASEIRPDESEQREDGDVSK
jgi:hypothetical protein